MKRLITLSLACTLLILSGCSKKYSMSPTGEGVYEFGKPEIGIYFYYFQDVASGLMTAENQTDFRVSVRIQRRYPNGEWGGGASFTLDRQGRHSYSEYYPKGTPLRVTIKRDGQEWILRVDLD